MARASRARAFLDEDDFHHGLDCLSELVPVRRSLQALRPEQQLKAWASYADQLESRLVSVHEQLVAARVERVVCETVRRPPGCDRPAAGRAGNDASDNWLEVLARLRAEQLMTVRLLNLLARCERLDVLARSGGEAASLLDARQRRELRAQDFAECLAEHQALRDAGSEGLARARERDGARRLALPGSARRMAVDQAARDSRTSAPGQWPLDS